MTAKTSTAEPNLNYSQLQNGSASDQLIVKLSARFVEIGRWRSRSVVECDSRFSNLADY